MYFLTVRDIPGTDSFLILSSKVRGHMARGSLQDTSEEFGRAGEESFDALSRTRALVNAERANAGRRWDSIQILEEYGILYGALIRRNYA